MTSNLSRKFLIVGYAGLTILYLYASIAGIVNNLYGNRTLGALLALTYFGFITWGLIKYPRHFSILSAVNFSIGTIFFGYIAISSYPKINLGLLAIVLVGVIGFLTSAASSRLNDI